MVEIKNLTRFYGNVPAVKNLTFTVEDGEILGFLGPNGAGKSTTMNMITGYLPSSSGTVLVDGFDEELEQFYGRTYADSPEIDGRVWIAASEAIAEGSFVKVTIDSVIDGDLSGYMVEE